MIVVPIRSTTPTTNAFPMKNARQVVQEIADGMIAYTNNEDGVIRTLQTMDEQGLLVFSDPTPTTKVADC